MEAGLAAAKLRFFLAMVGVNVAITLIDPYCPRFRISAIPPLRWRCDSNSSVGDAKTQFDMG